MQEPSPGVPRRCCWCRCWPLWRRRPGHVFLSRLMASWGFNFYFRCPPHFVNPSDKPPLRHTSFTTHFNFLLTRQTPLVISTQNCIQMCSSFHPQPQKTFTVRHKKSHALMLNVIFRNNFRVVDQSRISHTPLISLWIHHHLKFLTENI